MSATDSRSHLRENPLELARDQLRFVGEVFSVDPNLISVLSGVKKCVCSSLMRSSDAIRPPCSEPVTGGEEETRTPTPFGT